MIIALQAVISDFFKGYVLCLRLTFTLRSEQWSQAFFSLDAGGRCGVFCGIP